MSLADSLVVRCSVQVSPSALADRVQGYTFSRSPKVRAQAAVVLLACVERMQSSQLTAHAQPLLCSAGRRIVMYARLVLLLPMWR